MMLICDVEVVDFGEMNYWKYFYKYLKNYFS